MSESFESDAYGSQSGDTGIRCLDLPYACCSTPTEYAEVRSRISTSRADWTQRMVQVSVTPP